MDQEKIIKQILERLERLENAVFGVKDIRKPKKIGTFNFEMNERAFIRQYVKGLSGPKKFVLLLAYIVKGEAGKEISLNEIKERWNKMTTKPLMGYEFNLYYSSEAKNQGWVDSKKYGFYCLTPNWIEIFSKTKK